MKIKFLAKALVLMLLICVVTALFAGCGNTEGSSQPSADNNTQSSTETPDQSTGENGDTSGKPTVDPTCEHVSVTDPAVEPTCEGKGKTEGAHCKKCGEVLKAQEEVPAKGHTSVTDPAVAATCTTDGKTAGSHCSVCKAVLKKQDTIPASHTWSDTYQYDASFHWAQCEACNATGQKAAHDPGKDGYCQTCNNPVAGSNGLYYSISSDGTYAKVIDYLGYSTRISIAREYQGVPVTHIAAYAFKDKEFTTVFVPDTITSIGDSAFYDCSNLTSITIPDSVTSIGTNAFNWCTKLANIYCEAKTKPSGWSFNWRGTKCSATVHWRKCTTHTWENATCIKPQRCSDCTATIGTIIDHVYENGICSLCGTRNDSSIENIMNSKTQYQSLAWHNDASLGPVEIWSDTLQFLFVLNSSEIDASVGYETPETYNFYFDFYFKPTDSEADYTKATIQAWSVNKFNPNGTGNIIYRCRFYDALYPMMEVGTVYDLKIVVRQGSEIMGWGEQIFLWTKSCESFVQTAERSAFIFK